MKLVILISLLVNIIFANELVITKIFTLSKETEAKFLFSDINVISSSKLRNIGELSNKNRDKIINTINEIINEAKNTDICKGGSFYINPIISYDKGSRKTIGQNINFNLNCKFTKNDLNIYNNFLSNIEKHIAKNELLALPQPSLNYRITEDEINNVKEELFDNFLSTISNIEDKYSNLVDKKCKANNINYGESPKIYPMPLSAKVQDSTMSISAPIQDKTRIDIEIVMQLNCK